MSYSGSGLSLVSAAPLTGAGQRWLYRSTDVATDVDATDYFSDGDARGMRVGDIIEVTDTDTGTGGTTTIHRVTVVTAGGAATISATGTNIA